MFNSAKLNETFEKCQATIEEIPLKIKKISDDITVLEKYLQKQHIPDDVTLQIYEGPDEASMPNTTTFLYFFHCKIIHDSLFWDSNSKRLKFIRTEVEGCFDADGAEFTGSLYDYDPEKKEEKYNRPLVELPVQLRMHAHSYLSAFIEHVAKQYGYQPVIKIATSDDIPF